MREFGLQDSPSESTVTRGVKERMIKQDIEAQNAEILGFEDPQLASQEHWPQLRQTVERILAEVDTASSFSQLLGFPWQSGPELFSGEVVVLSKGVGAPGSLDVERDMLFTALKEHVPNHMGWKRLEDWKSAIRAVEAVLCQLCQLTEDRVDTRGLERISDAEARKGVAGIAGEYSKSIVLQVAEESCLGSRADHEYKVRGPFQHEGESLPMRLEWNYTATLFSVLASGPDRDTLNVLRTQHMDLCGQLLEVTEVGELVAAQQSARKARNLLKTAMEPLSGTVEWPGRCSLYSGGDG
jgi:hypothetical protein